MSLADLSSVRLLIVGDVMLDRYWFGDVSRISPEAPVPVVKVERCEERPGGAANVARNAAALGARVALLSLVGKDEAGESLARLVAEGGIDASLHVDEGVSTTVKLRVIGRQQQLLRIDFENRPSHEVLRAKLKEFAERLPECDAVVFSDYGKGVCTKENCQAIIAACKAHHVPVIVDPKGTNWMKYAGADYITPNLKEINAVLTDPIRNEDALVEQAARAVMKKFHLGSIIVTRSEAGLSLVREEEIEHIPTKAQEVFDVSGAGDTVIAVFAMGIAGGIAPVASAYLANLAAGVVVAKLGTYAVSREELLKALEKEK